jgi:hypothetical protein
LPAPQAAAPAADAPPAPAVDTPAAAPAEASSPKAAEVHVEAGEIDQETYDRLIAEGKPERMARAKAKAAFVKKAKAQLAQDAAQAPAADTTEAATQAAAPEVVEAEADAAPAPAAKQEIHVEAGEIDQETFDRLIAEGKPERMARAKAKAAYVKKRRQELEQEGGQ